MANHCPKCNGTDIQTIGNSDQCLTCGTQIKTGEVTSDGVEFAENPAPPKDNTEWVDAEALQAARDLIAAHEASGVEDDGIRWEMSEVRDQMVAEGEIAPRDEAMARAAREARAKAREKREAAPKKTPARKAS